MQGIGGITGTLLTGLFADVGQGSGVNGAFFYNDILYAKQIAGVLVVVFLSVVATTVIYWTLWAAAKALGTTIVIPEEHQVRRRRPLQYYYSVDASKRAGLCKRARLSPLTSILLI